MSEADLNAALVVEAVLEALEAASDALKNCRAEMPLGPVSRAAYDAVVQCTAALRMISAVSGLTVLERK